VHGGQIAGKEIEGAVMIESFRVSDFFSLMD
jgi:hypothetical protein